MSKNSVNQLIKLALISKIQEDKLTNPQRGCITHNT